MENGELYSRLPTTASVREEVARIAQNTSGGVMRFKSDSTKVWIQLELEEHSANNRTEWI